MNCQQCFRRLDLRRVWCVTGTFNVASGSKQSLRSFALMRCPHRNRVHTCRMYCGRTLQHSGRPASSVCSTDLDIRHLLIERGDTQGKHQLFEPPPRRTGLDLSFGCASCARFSGDTFVVAAGFTAPAPASASVPALLLRLLLLAYLLSQQRSHAVLSTCPGSSSHSSACSVRLPSHSL